MSSEIHIPKAIETNIPKETFSPEQVSKHLKYEGVVVWVPMEEALQGGNECIDGRRNVPVIGTPAGDMGYFTDLLATTESLTGEQLTKTQVSDIFNKYVKGDKKFYMHSDTHGMAHLAKELTDKSDGKTEYKAEDMVALINNPTNEVKDTLLELLVKPENNGCGHLRLSTQMTEQYGIRRELVEAAMQSFFANLWGGNNNLEFVVLEHNHDEKAVLNIEIEGELTDRSQIPAVMPYNEKNGTKLFVKHPQVEEKKRENIAERVLTEGIIPQLGSVTVDNLAKAIIDQGNKVLEQTRLQLAGSLPVYTAIYLEQE